MKIPNTDSIQALAEFWDSQDITDHEDELCEVDSPVFVRRAVTVTLTVDEQARLHRQAVERGVDDATLVGEWVRERLTG